MNENGTCTHCGTRLQGPFCAACGQRVRVRRLTTPRILREGVREFLDLETGLLRTVMELVAGPDRVIVGYWGGHTKPWVHPAKFFLLSFALAQFVAWRTGAFEAIAAGYMAGGSGTPVQSADALVAFLADYFVVLTGIGLVLPVGMGALMSSRTLAEHTVFAFYTFGALASVGSVLLVARLFLPVDVVDAVVVAAVPIYLAWALSRVFALGPVRSFVASMAYVGAVLVGTAFAAGVASGVARGTGG